MYNSMFLDQATRACVTLSRIQIGLIIDGDQNMWHVQAKQSTHSVMGKNWRTLIDDHRRHRCVLITRPSDKFMRTVRERLNVSGDAWVPVAKIG